MVMRQWQQTRESRVPGLAPLQPCLEPCCVSLSPSVKWVWGLRLHSTLPSPFAGQEVRLLTGRGGPMMEVAQPWDLLRPLPQHWRAPQLPQSQTHALPPWHVPDGPSTAYPM